MRLSVLFLFYLFTVLLFSCKKDMKPVAATPASCPTIDPTRFMGSFRSIYTLFYKNGQITSSQVAFAEFYRHPRSEWARNELVLQNVSVNGHTLTCSPDSTDYYLPGDSADLRVDSWRISGDSIPSFTYINKNPFPGCSDFFNCPDSISRSTGCSFTLANVTNMDYGAIYIVDQFSGIHPNTYSLSLTPGTNVVTLSPTVISTWALGTGGFVTITLNKASIVNACDRNYWFLKNTIAQKEFIIIP